MTFYSSMLYLLFGLAYAIPQLKPTYNQWTGFPNWISSSYSLEQQDSMCFMVTFVLFFSCLRSYLYIKDGSSTETFGFQSGKTKPTSKLIQSLFYYQIATALACLLFATVGAGKIWSVVGTFHNACEMNILFLFVAGGSFTKRNEILPPLIILIYFLATILLCCFMDFPIDALYFKWQGLILDFALVFQWYRLWMSNLPYEQQEPKTDIVKTYPEKKEKQERETSDLIVPNRIWLLIIGATIHLLGNIISTVFHNEPINLVLFHLSYAIAYPLITIYINLEGKKAHLLIYPEHSFGLGLMVGFLSFLGSCLTMGIAAFVSFFE